MFLMLCLSLTAALIFPGSALAREIEVDDTVKKGETLDQNVFLSGPSVVMDGVINGDLVAVGEEVTINGKVDGSVVAIGKNVLINGPVTGNAFVGALSLELGPESDIGKDVSYIGGHLETDETSLINRDLNILSLEADLSGTTDREVNGLIGPLNLIQAIYNYMVTKGWLPASLQLNSLFFQDRLDSQATLGMGFGLPSIQSLKLLSSAPQQGSTIDVERLKSWAVPFLRNFAALLILGLLVVWLVPARLSLAGEQVRRRPWRALLIGLLFFVIGWLSAILLFLLILALAIFLYWISLPNLGFLIGSFGLLTLGMAVTVFWLSITYFSKIIVATLVGVLLFKRFIPKYAHSRVWPLVTGVFLYALLASIPYLGWLVAVITTFIGLGALWMISNARTLPEDQPTVQLQPVVDEQEMSLLSEG